MIKELNECGRMSERTKQKAGKAKIFLDRTALHRNEMTNEKEPSDGRITEEYLDSVERSA